MVGNLIKIHFSSFTGHALVDVDEYVFNCSIFLQAELYIDVYVTSL